MSILDKIKITESSAPRITIYGIPGIGKSTLASNFPDPLFLLTEENGVDGSKSLGVLTDYAELWSNIEELLKLETFPFKTIVLDSLTKLDTLVTRYTLEKSPTVGKERRPAETLAEAWGGYGAGYEKAASLHKALKYQLDKFKGKGVAVVYIANIETKKYKSPEHDDYDILTITMNSDKSRSVYIDDVDAVLFCKIKSRLVEANETSGRQIIKSSDQHIIVSDVSAVHVSKNRFNLPKEIDMSFAELQKHIPYYNKPTINKGVF